MQQAELTRRGILAVAGGGVILAAGCSRNGAAGEPWRRAGSLYDDPMRAALSYAILAPNPHNRQPWLVDLQGPDEAMLYCQLDRRLPETDPYDRQIVIGLGCFLETFRIAATSLGRGVEIEPFPDGADERSLDARPVARLWLTSETVDPDPLFAHILNRRTDRGLYDDRTPPRTALRRVAGVSDGGRFEDEPEAVAKLNDLAWRAWEVETTDPDAFQESIDLMRIGRKEINETPDGLAIRGPAIEAAAMIGLITREKMEDPSSRAFKSALNIAKKPFAQTRAHVWFVSAGNTRRDQVQAGFDYMRAALTATGLGLAMQPLSQALQEYGAMAALYAEAQETLGAPEGGVVQMWVRIGYGGSVPPAPRWPLESRLMGG